MFPIDFVELLRTASARRCWTWPGAGVAVLAIKAMSRGGWPAGAERTRKWWYRWMEEPEEVDLAMRFLLSQPGVVAGIPPSFLDLLDKTIDAAKKLRPITPPEVERLREMAQTCESMFQKDDSQASWHRPPRDPLFPRNPHEGCGGHWA